MCTPQDLVDTLTSATPEEYVRIVADWLGRATQLEVEPHPTGNEVIDVLAAAASAHLSLRRGRPSPPWTNSRELASFWHPGDDRFFAWSLVHAPVAFRTRGILIEADSLVSV